MSFLRVCVALALVGLWTSSCASCGGPPAKQALKPEGEACSLDEQCESSLCDKLPGKTLVCLRKCSAGCKVGDVCTPMAAGERFACVPERPGLCQSCATDADCPYPADRCLEVAGTKVCARDCSFDGQCPSSYRCADGTATSGAFVTKQCQPTSGTCECTAASAGQKVPCAESNSFGTCRGVRTCRPPSGYEACTAPVPTSESCNGRDDDCNGMTDENLGETTCGTGECRHTVTNCVNGTPQMCEPLTPRVEICDEKDNDCDGVIDNGFDKQASLTHCGTCNTPCTRANATPVCRAGVCAIGQCHPGFVNADGVDSNGCEYQCTSTGPEVCDGVDNDCDGMTDEGFVLASDPNNCGQCGRVCNVANGHIATYACVASTCAIMTCSPGFSDCDQSYATGCERNVSADLNNCGGCNSVCTVAHGTPACVSGQCTIASCDAGWADCNTRVTDGCEENTSTSTAHCGGCNLACPSRPNATPTCNASSCGFACLAGYLDLDGQALNGCEYRCTATGADAPEMSFVDSNCDGVDGDASQAVFVATTGDDAAPGTRAQPKRTISTAIGAAASVFPKRAVYVSKGTYAETVVMQPGVSLYGGYDAVAGWTRSLTNTTLIASPNAVGVLAQNITLSAELQLFTITASNAIGTESNGDGRSSIGIHIVDSAAGLRVGHCTVTAGHGTAGASGPAGTVGAAGGIGGAAGLGVVTARGLAGTSSCGAPGGRGAAGVSGEVPGNDGFIGTQAMDGGTAGNPGTGGTAGSCSLLEASNGGNAPPVTAGGGPGFYGLNGIAGLALGTLSSTGGGYLPASGLAGVTGSPGGGAGGGGSGGGTSGGTNVLCTNCSSISSGGGGGGGGGGCGGTSGSPGRGGGGSFAILIANSSATVLSTTLRTNNGGAGGTGGAGGPGGAGGAGGQGALGYVSPDCGNRKGGAGANGARGGAGGQGGGASGGAGGPSICLAYGGSAPTMTGNTCSTGVAGAGGQGGAGMMTNAASGPPGTVTQVQAL